jgi:hypothetical protein
MIDKETSLRYCTLACYSESTGTGATGNNDSQTCLGCRLIRLFGYFSSTLMCVVSVLFIILHSVSIVQKKQPVL